MFAWQMWGRRMLLTIMGAVLTGGLGLSARAAQPNPGSYETRGAFVTNLALTMGLAPVFPPRPTFRDVPPNSPNYGYIEAAVAAGWVSGVSPSRFGPDQPLDRDEVAKIEVLALGYGAAARSLSSSPPPVRDAALVPRWAWGFVAEALKLGILKGDRRGDFLPEEPLTLTDEGYVVAQLKDFLAAKAPASVRVVAVPAKVQVGDTAKLLAVGYSVTGQPLGEVAATFQVTSPRASVHGDRFRSHLPGVYTISARTAQGLVGTGTVVVVSVPAALRMVTPTELIQDGVAEAHVQVRVVDAVGNPIHEAGLHISLLSSDAKVAAVVDPTTGSALPSAAALSLPSTGLATFTIRAGRDVGGKAVLTATVGKLHAQALVLGTRPTPAFVRVRAAFPCVEANDGNGLDRFTASLFDQAGQRIAAGSYPVTFSVAGAGTFAGGSDTAPGLYDASLPSPDAAVTVYVPKGHLGPVTVSARVGTAVGSATVTALRTGPPVALLLTGSVSRVTADQLAATVPGAPTLADSLTLIPVDARGCPTPWGSAAEPARALLAESLAGVSTHDLSLPQQITFTGQTAQTVPVLAAPHPSDDRAGRYTFSVRDAAGELSGARTTLTVLPGRPARLAIVAPLGDLFVPSAHPDVTVVAQVEDAEGNPVHAAGIRVRFRVVATAGTPARVTPVAAATNRLGVARTTLTLPPALGASAQVAVASSTPGIAAAPPDAESGTLTVELHTTSRLAVALMGARGGEVRAGTALSLAIREDGTGYPRDLLQLRTSGFAVTVRPDAAGAVATHRGGVFSGSARELEALLLRPLKAGTSTVAVTDLSTLKPLSASARVRVVAGPVQGFAITDRYGDDLAFNNATPRPGAAADDFLAFGAGVPTPVWLTPVDRYGNPSTNTTGAPLTIDLVTSGAGVFRLTPQGPDVTSVQLAPGEGKLLLYYVNDTTFVSYDDLVASYLPVPATLTLSPSTAALPPGGEVTFLARVKDALGLPDPGVAVSFRVTGAGTLSTVSAVSDARGVAFVTFRAPFGSGVSSVTAVAVRAKAHASVRY